MALFTDQEAANCTILKCDSIKKAGLHKCWNICIKDDNDKCYNWFDSATSSDATDEELKAAIKSHLMGAMNKQVSTTTATPKSDLVGSNLS